jgi:hypothetical protein
MHMPSKLFVCGRSWAADPTSSLNRGPAIDEDLKCARREARNGRCVSVMIVGVLGASCLFGKV